MLRFPLTMTNMDRTTNEYVRGDSSSWAVETQEDGWLIYWTKVVEDVAARQEEDMQRVGAA